MSFFQLRSQLGNRWPALPNNALAPIWNAYLTLDRTQWLSRAEIEQQQLSQARILLDHCVQHVPYYRDLLAANGIVIDSIRSMSDFRRIPLLSRRTSQERFDELCARELPEGTVALDEDNTSGTSGSPVRILKTNVFYLWWLAFYLRDLEWSGLNPTGKMAAIRTTLTTGVELERLLQGERFGSWHAILESLIEMGPLHGMDLRQDPRRQLDWLQQVDPDYILSHTSNLELLTSLLREEPRRFPRLRAIQAISETLSAEARIHIETAFGAPVKNLYSCAEAGYLASPCPAGEGLHVHAENVIFEVLDEGNQPCKSGETGRVVLTVLHNFRTPFIRYEIGDDVTLGPEDCPCGRGLPLLMRVDGKRRTMFRVPGNRLKHSSGLVHAISQVGGHHQHQVVQKAPAHVVVRIVPTKAWSTNHSHRLRQAVQEFFEAPIRMDLEIKERLEVPLRGKLQSMICEVPL